MNVEDRDVVLRRIQDLEAIKQLKAKYFWCVDKKLWIDWASVFTEDIEADFSDDFSRLAGRPIDGVIRGRHKLVSMISASLPKEITSVHQGHMPQIEFTGPDTATGVWQLQDCIDDGDRQLIGFGYYRDGYVRQNGQWLIKRFALERLLVEWRVKEKVSPPERLRALFQ